MIATSRALSRASTLGVILLALALIAAACGDDGEAESPGAGSADGSTTTSQSGPQSGGEATILMSTEFMSADPVLMGTAAGASGQMGFALYGALLVNNSETFELEPLLAESFEPSADFLTWTLRIKPGITMVDGSPYDAEAVKLNWERAKDPSHRSPSLLTMFEVADLTVSDPLTLTVVLKQPNAHFDKAVARQGLNFIASAEALNAGKDLTSEAAGAGPFKLDQWLRDDRMIMSKNPDWKGGEGPYLDRLTFRVVSDEEQRIDTFVTGDGDAFYTSTPASVKRAQDAVDGAYYAKVDVTTGQAFSFNTTKPPFDDLRVREAFVRGVDWQSLVSSVAGEGAEALTNMTLESTPWYAPNAVLPGYDPVAAQELVDEYIAEHGGQPLAIAVTSAQTSNAQAASRFVQTSLSQLDNVDVTVDVVDSGTLITKLTTADYMASYGGFPVLFPDPDLYVSVHGESMFYNLARYSNPEVDRLLDEARLIPDAAKSKPLYDEVWEAVARDIPFYPFVHVMNGFASSPQLKDVTVTYDGVMRFDLIWKAA